MTRRAARTGGRDRGSALIIALVLVTLAGLVVLPVLEYSQAVSRQTRVLQSKTTRVEAVKGGIRTVLANPIELYRTCDAAGLNVPVNLASPGLATGVSTRCWKMSSALAEDPATLRYGTGTTRVGSAVPADVVGPVMPNSGGSPANAWTSLISDTPSDDKVWVPLLPTRHLNLRTPLGWTMPAGYPACRVYFPGTYVDPITIDGSIPVYFASGVYYFENTVRFTGNARVVVGGGATAGCTNDQEAAFYASGAPSVHGISGIGGTFVFGAGGRLQIDDTGTGSGMSVVFNQRYVSAADVSSTTSARVSIASVNGEMSGATQIALDRPGVLFVPPSRVAGATPVLASTQGYQPSTLVAVPTPAPLPIVEVTLNSVASVRLEIPGYVAVPQGRVVVSTATTAAANKNVSIGGGVLAAAIEVSPTRPATFALGLVNPVVLSTFKIVSTTTSGTPLVASTAIVQVKENGAYAVNSWETQ